MIFRDLASQYSNQRPSNKVRYLAIPLPMTYCSTWSSSLLDMPRCTCNCPYCLHAADARQSFICFFNSGYSFFYLKCFIRPKKIRQRKNFSNLKIQIFQKLILICLLKWRESCCCLFFKKMKSL